MNVQWDTDSSALKCRVVNRGAGRPHLIVGDFLEYLLACHKRRVRAITIIPD
jgi:hypothetical protein